MSSNNYKQINKKFDSEYEYFDSLSASTIDEAFTQMSIDKDNTIHKLIFRQMLQSHRNRDLFQDAKQHLFLELYKYVERDGEDVFLAYYNSRKDFRFWLSKVCYYQFALRSAFYREYNHVSSLPITFPGDELLPEGTTEHPSVSNETISKFSSFEFIGEMNSLLYSDKAKEQFCEEEIDLFYYYITRKKKGKYTKKRMAEELDISAHTTEKIINRVKDFVLKEIKK